MSSLKVVKSYNTNNTLSQKIEVKDLVGAIQKSRLLATSTGYYEDALQYYIVIIRSIRQTISSHRRSASTTSLNDWGHLLNEIEEPAAEMML